MTNNRVNWVKVCSLAGFQINLLSSEKRAFSKEILIFFLIEITTKQQKLDTTLENKGIKK